MGDNGSVVDSNSAGLSSVLVYEKGSSNKRKYFPDLSLEIPSELSLTEFPRYEILEEKLRSSLTELGSIMEPEVEEFQKADWEDPVACQLEELLTNNLFATFHGAVKKIVEYDYTEEAALWAILNSGLFHGSKDAVSNVVDGALALLRREKEFSIESKYSVFEDLQSLVEYTILEMIHVLREVRPDLTIGEAMWCLLMSDLNLLNACVVEGGLSGDSCEPKVENPDTKDQSSQPGSPKSKSRSTSKESSVVLEEVKGKFPGIIREHIQTLSQAMVVDEKSGGSKKGSSGNSKRDMLRQKTFHFEKSYKGRMSKGAFKAKVAAWGSMVLDKSLKSGSSSVLMKGTYSKLGTSAGTNGSQAEVQNRPSKNPQSDPKSPAISNPCSKGKTGISNPPKAIDYYAGIPYDDTLQKYVPQDDKDKTILMLVSHKEALEKEVQGWVDWANEKVMQAARKLGKDQVELKTLRQEKEETEKFNKEKQTLEENTAKRVSEMENALSNATGQIKGANSSVERLEEENSLLHKDMEAAKLQAVKSAIKLHEAVMREQEALKNSQLWDAEKGLLLEQLTKFRRQTVDMKILIEKAKGRQDQFKVRLKTNSAVMFYKLLNDIFQVLLKHEEKEKVRVSTQIDSLRGKREEDNALTNEEVENIKQNADTNLNKCIESIKNLENINSQLRMESNKSKIAALNVGYTGNENVGKRLAVFEENFGVESVKPERECVMCMTEEISVVFLPCAHQVLCGECSRLLVKQGMNDCPSCRTTIQKRISVSYRVL
ncbi:hypothetical protein RD792_009396 [Penstemon davidsonii]|uniref:RING-type domain-containing protein n=1 Tax=Penstemon davidsonii TaxID=160366 RepID=A0ABR0CZU5_9LAMI|nr:hypothetical protein RD792_009396 [Penstemon davidsonii]